MTSSKEEQKLIATSNKVEYSSELLIIVMFKKSKP